MITRPDDPAYPIQTAGGETRGYGIPPSPGMTKREEFAKVIMQGVLASSAAWPSPGDLAAAAEYGVMGADALITALNKEATTTSNDHR